MQNRHISGGRTHRKDATSFRFLDIGHAPFSSLERGKNLKFQRIRIMPVMLGMKRKLVISRIRKNTCSAFIYCSDHTASHAGYETKARDIKNQKKHLQCICLLQ